MCVTCVTILSARCYLSQHSCNTFVCLITVQRKLVPRKSRFGSEIVIGPFVPVITFIEEFQWASLLELVCGNSLLLSRRAKDVHAVSENF
jgi:hypothetical protein